MWYFKYLDSWYCVSKEPIEQHWVFWLGGLLDLLFHTIYLIGSITSFIAVTWNNRFLFVFYQCTTFIALIGFICVRVYAQKYCQSKYPFVSLVVKELWFAFGFWFCTVAQSQPAKKGKNIQRGLGIGNSEPETFEGSAL